MEVRAPQVTGPARARLASVHWLWGLLITSACNTDAVGVNECRDVEYARCEASVACGVIEEDEVEECKRFYRDHCLHGMKGDEVPTADEHKECLDLIEDAGKAARTSLGMGGAGEPDERSCKIIAAPWKSEECAYLVRSSSSMGGGE